MTDTTLFQASLPVAREVAAASQGQRALAAFLSTQLDTQRIQIFDDKDEAHVVDLPTSALRLLVDILAELAEGLDGLLYKITGGGKSLLDGQKLEEGRSKPYSVNEHPALSFIAWMKGEAK